MDKAEEIIDHIANYAFEDEELETFDEIINDWTTFQSKLLKRVTDMRDSLESDLKHGAGF